MSLTKPQHEAAKLLIALGWAFDDFCSDLPGISNEGLAEVLKVLKVPCPQDAEYSVPAAIRAVELEQAKR